MNKKFDCAVILGFKLKKKNKIPSVLKSRLNVAIKLYKKGLFEKFVVVGGMKNKNLDITEAEAMKRYLIRKGIHSRNILKEETSLDTIGNAFFLKQKILKPRMWKNLIVITSDFHLERTRIIFEKILGKRYKMKFIGSKSLDISTFFYKISGVEKDLIEVTKTVLKKVKDGNDEQIKRMIKEFHMLYSKSARKLLTLSDEELARKLGVDIIVIKRLRKIIKKVKIKNSG
jgi:uncharacterized SAM-binding protein YcdF (DUF218 family)